VVRFAGRVQVVRDGDAERWRRLAPPPDLPVPLVGDAG
jgi:hypothetical protein